jgi:hypothetical protein
MSEIKQDDSLNVKELMAGATEVGGSTVGGSTPENPIDESELSKPVGGDWWAKNKNQDVTSDVDTTAKIINVDNQEPNIPADNVNLSSGDSYHGPGLIVDSKELADSIQPEVQPKYTGVTPETEGYVDNYMKAMDEDIEAAKHIAEMKKSEMQSDTTTSDDEDNDEEPQMTKDEFDRSYNEAIVVIDKTGMGTIIDFTDEERAKLEKVKKIKIEEIETISLQSFKTKKIKKKENLEKLLKRQANIHTTPIVLPASGYTATIRGCSTYELIALMGEQQNVLMDTEAK